MDIHQDIPHKFAFPRQNAVLLPQFWLSLHILIRKHIIIMFMDRILYKITMAIQKNLKFSFRLIPFCISFSLFSDHVKLFLSAKWTIQKMVPETKKKKKNETSVALPSFLWLWLLCCCSLLMFFHLRFFWLQSNVHKYTCTPVYAERSFPSG